MWVGLVSQGVDLSFVLENIEYERGPTLLLKTNQ
jgi:hypothetical protein